MWTKVKKIHVWIEFILKWKHLCILLPEGLPVLRFLGFWRPDIFYSQAQALVLSQQYKHIYKRNIAFESCSYMHQIEAGQHIQAVFEN